MSKKLPGLHRKDGEERQPDDFYATSPRAIPPLLKVLGWEQGGKYIYEPAAGKGHLAEMLKLYGHKVLATDLIDRGYCQSGVDFLQSNLYDFEPYDALITNPPYKYALEFVKKSLTVAPVACHFLNIKFLESARRRDFFKTNPPRYVCVFSERMDCSKDGIFPKTESSAVCYAWFIWFRGFTGRPEIIWL